MSQTFNASNFSLLITILKLLPQSLFKQDLLISMFPKREYIVSTDELMHEGRDRPAAKHFWGFCAQVGRAVEWTDFELVHHKAFATCWQWEHSWDQENCGLGRNCLLLLQSTYRSSNKLSFKLLNPGHKKKKILQPLLWILRNACIQKMFLLWGRRTWKNGVKMWLGGKRGRFVLRVR